MDFAFTIAGFVVGFIVGFTGIGGGSLMTPILVLGFSISPAVAIGTDLLYAAITKCGGIFVHNKKGNINWRIVALLCSGSIPSTIAAIFLLKYLNAIEYNIEPVMTKTLSVSLILTSLVLLFKSQIDRFVFNTESHGMKSLHQRLQEPLTITAGILIGFFVTLSSVGAGALGAAILLLLYPKLPAIKIVGTDLAHAVPITAIAGLGHMHLGTVNFSLLISLLIGSLPGIYAGSHFGTVIPDKVIRPILALILLAIGIKMALV